MRFQMRIVVAVYLVCGALSPSVRAQSNTDEQAIVALETRYGAAVQSNNVPFIAAHLAPTYQGIQADGVIQGRDGLLAARKRNAYQVKNYEVIKQKVTISGATAVVTKCLRVDYTVDSKHISGDFAVSRVWQKSGKDWQILLLQMTSRATPCSE